LQRRITLRFSLAVRAPASLRALACDDERIASSEQDCPAFLWTPQGAAQRRARNLWPAAKGTKEHSRITSYELNSLLFLGHRQEPRKRRARKLWPAANGTVG
jgi:hypothetical protein